MIQSRMMAAAVLSGLVVAAAGLTAVPSNGSARAVEPQATGIAGERIATAFALAPAVASHSVQFATRVTQKGDLGMPPACLGAAWPDVGHGCLVLSDGSPAPAIRSVTVATQSGESTTVLMRMPAQPVASR